MAKAKLDVELDEDDFLEEDESPETEIGNAKTNLTRRRQIDDYLDERRLQKQLSDYDFDLD